MIIMRYPQTTSWKHNRYWLFGLAIALIYSCSLTTTQAQQWQYVYGGDNSEELGYNNVAPVEGTCAGSDGGYIAIGADDAQDVYIVRTDNNGAYLWEFTYDIRNDGTDDIGYSIIELSDGSGFVACGRTGNNNSPEAFFLKIDCDGDEVWTQRYPADSGYSVAYDLIEATTGNGTNTQAGDLVACGAVLGPESGGSTSLDGLIFRTTSNGALIWNHNYKSNSIREDEEFMQLIEATPIGLHSQGYLPTGDIIAVGTHISSTNQNGSDYQGLVIRVDGNYGTINTGGPLQQGFASFGDGSIFMPTADVFLSVVELQNPADTGLAGLPNVVVAGFGTKVNTAVFPPTIISGFSNFLVKLRDGDPCDPIVESYVGYQDYQDEAYDIVEIPYATGPSDPVNQWDLVITGRSNAIASGANMDAHMLGIDPATLGPIANAGMVYHPNSGTDAQEIGYSLNIVDDTHNKTQGFIMCGWTTSDWLSVSDAQDMYLVKTDLTLSSGTTCEDDYDPDQWTNAPYVCLEESHGTPLDDLSDSAAATARDWDDEVCTSGSTGGKLVPGIGLVQEAGYTVTMAPNPVRTGEMLTVLFQGSEMPESLKVSVANSLGEAVQEYATTQLNADGTLAVDTDGWTSGVYFINIDDGSYSRTIRVVLVE